MITPRPAMVQAAGISCVGFPNRSAASSSLSSRLVASLPMLTDGPAI